MELSQNPHKDTIHDITSIMAILAHADTTITPKIMAGINTLASTQETHQDDTEIMHQARVRLSTATAEDIERILSFLHTLKDSQANFPNKISLIGELKTEIATHTEKPIKEIVETSTRSLTDAIEKSPSAKARKALTLK